MFLLERNGKSFSFLGTAVATVIGVLSVSKSMFKITVLCVLAVNGENLCMFGDLPITRYNTPQGVLVLHVK